MRLGYPELTYYVWSILKTKDGTLAEIANSIDQNLPDKHSFRYDIKQLQFDTYETFIMELLHEVRDDAQWSTYVQEITRWLLERKVELGV